ncbi:MAG: type II toxin-antitoxin system PemK/MazF family toxin [Chloroflexi bacterium]|nr:type II toxin-antitoxin system PemK/MazF family toxin [Chloroflexota bacterium]
MRRGELWWANLAPPSGRRPVLLLSRDDAYAVRSLIMVTQVTTRIRDIPAEVRLGREDGLSRPSVANLDTIITINKNRLDTRIGMLDPKKLEAVDAAIHYALGMEE